MGPSRMNAMQWIYYKMMESGFNAWKKSMLYDLVQPCAIYLCFYSLNVTPFIRSYCGNIFVHICVVTCNIVFASSITYLNQQKKTYSTLAFSSLMKYYKKNQTKIFLCFLPYQYHFLIGPIIMVISLLMNNNNGAVMNLSILLRA
jgi:hypothetical protein